MHFKKGGVYTLKKSSSKIISLKIENNSSGVNFTHFRKKNTLPLT